jgi:hypothetical protein
MIFFQILVILCLDYLTCLEFYFEVLLNMLEYANIMSRLPYMSSILFLSIAKHITILF